MSARSSRRRLLDRRREEMRADGRLSRVMLTFGLLGFAMNRLRIPLHLS